MANYFAKSGNVFSVESDAFSENFPTLPGGNYLVKFHPMKGFYLETMDVFKLPKKIYGDHQQDAKRILNTFKQRPATTGVLLSGEKGSGKTLLSKLISHNGAAEDSIPTLVINETFTGDAFSTFLSSIVQPAILFFDEFEKVYPAAEQNKILTLMDGVFHSKKLFLLTVNDKFKVDAHMRNRPGRIYYLMEYRGLDVQFIREYSQDNLVNKDHVTALCTLSSLFSEFNFDMLQAVIEEMNRYGDTPSAALRLLNCKPDTDVQRAYTVELRIKGQLIPESDLEDDQFTGSPLNRAFYISYMLHKTVMKDGKEEEDTDWFNATFSPEDLTRMNADAGIFILKNSKDEEVILRKKTPKTFDYRSVLDRRLDGPGLYAM